MQSSSKPGLVAALLLTLSFSAGCAEEREPINRVQPNALDKTFFVEKLNDDLDNPVFYSKAFVIDQSAGQAGLSVGLYSGTDRVKWEITEDYLIARKGYQIVRGQDHHGLPEGEPNGVVVGRFRIASHFDVKRSYNPQTGEELNVLEENVSDRPWHERRYMRVDWSTNDVNDPMFAEIFLGKIFGDVNVLPLTYTVTDPDNEDAPYFEPADGYFDVTNRFYIEPGTTEKWGLKLPTCGLIGLYTGTTSNDCNGQEATLRHSFWKVKPDHDFEPMENTKRKFDVVANFGGAGDSLQPGFAGGTTQCWDPQYAYTEACFHQYMVKLNFWAKSHSTIACSSDADADRDGTADECAAYVGAKGSQCDLFFKKCTLPLRDRQIKAVGYWMNKETPLELLDELDQNGNLVSALDASGVPRERGPMEDVIKSWNQLLMAAFAYGREAECRRTGDADRQACHELFFETDGGRDRTQMISFGAWGVSTAKALPQDAPAALVSCHAPVRAYDDHGVCGKTGEVARNGDQRKNWIFYWPHDSDARYGGVAGLGQDPETGESHGTTATVMGRAALRAAANYRDYLLYAMGDLSLDDIAQGVPQFIFQKVAENGFSPNSELGRRARGETIEYANKTRAEAPAASRSESTASDARMRLQNLRTLIGAQQKSGYDAALQGQAQPLWESYARKLRGTPYEAELVDPGWAMSAVGSDPREPLSASTLDAASPFRNLDSGRLALFRAEVSSKLASRGVCFTEDVPRIGSINFQGMSRWYLDKFAELGLDADIAAGGARDPELVKQRAEYIFRDLFKGMAKGIAIHEVGHCLGMRHNFASSWDAPNFMPQYWQLRTKDGAAMQSCGGGRDPSQPDICMGPRYFDPETEDEQGLALPDASGRSNGRPGIGYFGNTSVMEYEVDYLSPGIGTYDYHYIKAVYGGVLETYDIDRVAEGGIAEEDQERFLVNMALQLSELSMLDDNAAHYTTLSRNLNVFDESYCRDATPEELAWGEWRVVHGKICSQSPRDHAFWKDFSSDAEGGTRVPSAYADILNFSYWHTQPDRDGRSRQRWSYRYGETYGTGYMHTNPIDTGADVYEVTINNSKLYDLTYPLSYFRRGNKEYRYDNIPAAIADRYFERARAYHWILEGNDAYLQQFGELYPAYSQARQEAFYFLARAALAPEPGPMAGSFRPDGSIVYDVEDQATLLPEFRVALIDGRYVSQEFSNAQGGNWDYLSWIDHAAYNIERGLAMRALLDGRPTLFTISRETYLDGRNVMKNFRVDQALGLDRLLGGMLSDDWTNVGMWAKDMIQTSDGGPPFASLQMMNLLDPSPSRPAGSVAVFPNVGYKTELATVLFAHLVARMNSDMTLINKMRVYVLGLDFLGAMPDNEQVRFTDPLNGYTYIARRYGPDAINGQTIDSGIASRMLSYANKLLARAYLVEENAGQPVLDVYGAPKLLSNVPKPEGAVAGDALRKYVGLLDASRQVGRILDGPLDGTTPPED